MLSTNESLPSPYAAVCNGQCRVSDCCEKCEKPMPVPEPIRSCGAYTCPSGWTPKDTIDPGMAICVVDPVNGCTKEECCVRKYY
jgi:hypothetical protein